MSEPVAKAMLLCPEALQSDVVTDLRELWKAIGEPDDAQETKLQEIEKRVAEVVRAAVQAEEGHKTQLAEELEHTKCQLSELSEVRPGEEGPERSGSLGGAGAADAPPGAPVEKRPSYAPHSPR